ncbi:hypothetical protein CTI12_AA395510 [Artemisia annua]|uniref:Uncharacterized protein n=1 Tax=Artemisia annua TaxID=35608 RepID=A0A2U1MCL5_ARTAN|nr:hypothetical protein CTI12_AA395510 [Artemisia annua]
MAPKFPKCMKIAKQIGDRRIGRVLHEVFSREFKAYRDEQNNYNERIEEILVRVEERHGIIAEMKKFVDGHVLDEALADLKASEQEDFAEIGRLMQMSHAAAFKCAMLEEGQRFSHFDVAHWDGMECLVQAQARNGVILQAFLRLLDVLREVREEKRKHVMVMEVHE